MATELTAEDLWPVVAKLAPKQQHELLVRLRGRLNESDAEANRRMAEGPDELTDTGDALWTDLPQDEWEEFRNAKR